MDAVQICNMALSHLMTQDTIMSLEPPDKTPAGRACKLFYDIALDTALQEYPWGFATKRVRLALVGTDVVTNWAFAYAYPSDCLDLRAITIPGMRDPSAEQAIPFDTGNVADAMVIFTDLEQAEVIYTGRVTNTRMFTPMFSMALSYLVGSLASSALGKPELAVPLLELYTSRIMMAAGKSMNESAQGAAPEGSIVEARR